MDSWQRCRYLLVFDLLPSDSLAEKEPADRGAPAGKRMGELPLADVVRLAVDRLRKEAPIDRFLFKTRFPLLT
jgi:hypothetical protein